MRRDHGALLMLHREGVRVFSVSTGAVFVEPVLACLLEQIPVRREACAKRRHRLSFGPPGFRLRLALVSPNTESRVSLGPAASASDPKRTKAPQRRVSEGESCQ